jgi:hypothetical protein
MLAASHPPQLIIADEAISMIGAAGQFRNILLDSATGWGSLFIHYPRPVWPNI